MEAHARQRTVSRSYHHALYMTGNTNCAHSYLGWVCEALALIVIDTNFQEPCNLRDQRALL